PAAAAPQEGVSYGPVKSSDTLWAIARQLRPNQDISVQQMMMALLEANPYAFIDGNINRLKKGYVLRVDDPALFTAMSKAEAAREVSRQTREWQDRRAAAAEKAEERSPASDAQDAPASAAAPSEPKLKLVAPEGETPQAGAAAEGEPTTEGEMSEQLMLALESSAAQRKENEALKSRVEELEQQLQDMQKLIALKDADLAALQGQLREEGEAVSLPSEQQASSEEPDQPAEEEGAEQAAGAQEQAADKAEDEKQETAAKPEPEKRPEPKPQPKPQPKPAPEPGFIEGLMQSPMLLAAVGGGLLLLLVLAVVLVRRRRKGGFQESILSGGTSSMLNANEGEGSGETSFLSDLAISGMGGGNIAADEGEVDPLTEADVFMAYGRNQQAEEVLKKALEANPDRPEVAAKLLEVYYSSKDQEQFESTVGEWSEKLQQNDELWGKVAAMGREMMPDSDVFARAEVDDSHAEPPPPTNPEPVTDDVLDIGLDLDELTAEMESEAGDDSMDLGMDFDTDEEKAKSTEEDRSSEASSDEMDFDLDLGEHTQDAESTEPTEEKGGEQSAESELDFDLGDLGAEDETAAEAPAASESEEPSGADSDLDFDMSELEGLAGEEEAPGAEEEPSFDLDIGGEEEAPAAEEPSFDLDAGGEEEADTAGDTQSDSSLDDMSLDDLDFGELDTEGESAASEQGAEGETGSLDLSDLESDAGDLDDFGDLGELEDDEMMGDGDEIATKLDLASAYIEMGDSDGARSMLEEVVQSGSDEQKQQAQELLDKI
ncbi:MAG: FimV/HubP family polar landmark protein, partial [Pseudomonadota bacterium]